MLHTKATERKIPNSTYSLRSRKTKATLEAEDNNAANNDNDDEDIT
jgi:hypothetical protein